MMILLGIVSVVVVVLIVGKYIVFLSYIIYMCMGRSVMTHEIFKVILLAV